MAGLGQRQRWKKDCHLEIQDDILATELYFQAFPDDLNSYQRYDIIAVRIWYSIENL